MNKYIDSIKEVQAALENTTKYTNSTEEELLARLTNSIESLIGSDSQEGSLKKVINDLSVDLHNYEQITGTLINEELKNAVKELSTTTNDLQLEVEKQLEAIDRDSNATSNQLRDFNTELDKVNTDTLITRLDKLSSAIDKYAEKILKDSITYDEDAYGILNDIAWNKTQWQKAWDIEDWATMEDMEKSTPAKYQELIDKGYGKLAYTIMGLNSEQAVAFKDELKNTNQSDWDKVLAKPEYQQAFNEQINKALGSDLNEIAWLKQRWQDGDGATKQWAEEEAKSYRLRVRKLMNDIGEKDFVTLMDRLGTPERSDLVDWIMGNSNATKEDRDKKYDETNNTVYDKKSFNTARDISDNKSKWQSGWDVEDWDFMRSLEEATPEKYQELINNGFGKVAYTMMGLDSVQSAAFVKDLKNTQQADWGDVLSKPEYQKAFNHKINEILSDDLNELARLKKEYENGNDDTKQKAEEQAHPLRTKVRKLMKDIGEKDFVALMDKIGASDRDNLVDWIMKNPEATSEDRNNKYNETEKDQVLEQLKHLLDMKVLNGVVDKGSFEYQFSKDEEEKAQANLSRIRPELAELSKLSSKDLSKMLQKLKNTEASDWDEVISNWQAEMSANIEKEAENNDKKALKEETQSQKVDSQLQQSDEQLQRTDEQISTVKETNEQFGEEIKKFGVNTDNYSASVDEQGRVAVHFDDGTVRFYDSITDFSNYVGSLKDINKELMDLLKSLFYTEIEDQNGKTSSLESISKSALSAINEIVWLKKVYDKGGEDAEWAEGKAQEYYKILIDEGYEREAFNLSKMNTFEAQHYYNAFKYAQPASTNSASVNKKANGDLFTDFEIDNIDENGKELVIPSGRLRMMEYGDQIVPHGISENLLKWGTMNPALLNSTPEKVNNITNTDRSLHYNIENINLSEVRNGGEFIGDLNRYLQRTNTLNY